MSTGVQLYEPFINSVKKILLDMANMEVVIKGAFSDESEEIATYGVTSVINYTGKVKGRFMIDMEPGLALALAQNVNGIYYDSVKDSMVLATISEMNNIIAGHAVSTLNNLYSLGLWLSPPYVFSGKDIVVCIPKIPSASIDCQTKYGRLKVNVAFERSGEVSGR
jgi:chemotaxis protein CheX